MADVNTGDGKTKGGVEAQKGGYHRKRDKGGKKMTNKKKSLKKYSSEYSIGYPIFHLFAHWLFFPSQFHALVF